MNYSINDGNAYETAESLDEAAGIIEDWYDFLLDQGQINVLPAPDLDASSVDALQASIDRWENEIAEKLGKKPWSGHGTYYVSAASEAGFQLTVEVEENA